MRIIPGKTKIQVEIFKGISLWDMLVAAIGIILMALIVLSNLSFKIIYLAVILLIFTVLLVRIDKEPNYIYVINMVRHFSFKRKFDRDQNDEELAARFEKGDKQVAFDILFDDEGNRKDPDGPAIVETKEEKKARRKAEKEERKEDDRKLKSGVLTKEQEDAIWLKRAEQSAAKKDEKINGKSDAIGEMHELSAFTGIADGYIEYNGQYYGAALEIPGVEFRFFSQIRRNSSIEAGLGAVLRSINPEFSANIVKLERPIDYDGYITLEYSKLDELKNSFEEGFINEQELKARIGIVYDRINRLLALRNENKVVVPFYYLIFFDSDKHQLDYTVDSAMDTLSRYDMSPVRLDDKGLALMLKYSNSLDFDEHEIDSILPRDYALWAMPQEVLFNARTTRIDGILSHNFRVTNFPVAVDDAWLASLMTYPSTKVVVKMKPMVNTKAISAIDRSLSELRAKIMSARTDSEVMEAQAHADTLQTLLSMLQGDNEQLLNVNIYVSAYDAVLTKNQTKDFEGSYRAVISNMKKAVRRIWSESGFRLNNMEFNQATAFIGSQISGYDPLEKKGRGIPSNTMGASFPWVFPSIMDTNGVQIGSDGGVPVFVDFFRRDSERVNSNMVIVGKSGSGKSYATKSLLANLAADDAKIFILDPEDEYTVLARNLKGKFINVGNAMQGRLNPFNIITNLDDEESEGGATGSYAAHLQFLEEFFRQILPDCDKDSLEYLNNLVDRVYTNRGIDDTTDLSKLKPEDYPIFDDLYDEILREFQRTDNEYIRTMLRTLMNYVSKFAAGGRNSVLWNGPSSITTEENFTVFNFQSLLANRNSTIANAQMLLVLKYIDNEIIKNRAYNEKYKLNRKIVVVIDEAHVFIDAKYPVALDFMFQLAKRIRKYNGMQIVITQNIKDFVGSEDIARKASAIINACQYSFIFSLSPNDMDDLCKLYEKAGGINEAEQEQIVQAGRGEAFTVMSPTSRSSFKITVPDGVASLFSDPGFETGYFTGAEGNSNWNQYMGDAATVREAKLSERKISGNDVLVKDDFVGNVSFSELTEDEYEAEQFSASTVTFSESEDDKSSAKDTENIWSRRNTEDLPSGLDVSALTQGIAPVVIQNAGSTKTEELLASLVDKLGTQALVNEIRRTVREEMEREGAAPVRKPARSSVFGIAQDDEDDGLFNPSGSFDRQEGSEAPSSSGGALGSIFDILDSETENNDSASGASSADDEPGSTFDIMDFLSMQAENMAEEEDSAIDEFISGDETLLEVTLEQLIAYNRKKNH